jgi:hypothetical protein
MLKFQTSRCTNMGAQAPLDHDRIPSVVGFLPRLMSLRLFCSPSTKLPFYHLSYHHLQICLAASRPRRLLRALSLVCAAGTFVFGPQLLEKQRPLADMSTACQRFTLELHPETPGRLLYPLQYGFLWSFNLPYAVLISLAILGITAYPLNPSTSTPSGLLINASVNRTCGVCQQSDFVINDWWQVAPVERIGELTTARLILTKGINML